MKNRKILKKKKREKEAKKKVLARREKIRFEAKVEREKAREEKRLREKIDPYVKEENLENMEDIYRRKEIVRTEKMINSDINEAKMQLIKAKNKNLPDGLINHLERNYDILLALKDEFLQEQESRENLNTELEEKGLHTMKDKMEYLGDQSIKEQKETAIVEVVKANSEE